MDQQYSFEIVFLGYSIWVLHGVGLRVLSSPELATEIARRKRAFMIKNMWKPFPLNGVNEMNVKRMITCGVKAGKLNISTVG